MSDLWGDGTGPDLWGDGTGTDLWGPAASIEPRLVRVAIRGTVFSTSFENETLGETWQIHRLAHHLRGTRVPSVLHTD